MAAASILQSLGSSGFQIAAVFICVSCLYFTLVSSKPDKLQNKIFLLILVNILVSSMCDVTNGILRNFKEVSQLARILNECNQYVYFLFHAVLSPLFCFYISVVTGANCRLKRKLRYVYEFPMYVAEFFVLVNPLTRWVYDFDENFNFTRRWAENLIYVVGIGYFVAAAALILFLWNAITAKKRRTLIYFFVMVALGMGIQFLFPQIQIELFAESLAMTGIMITVENESDRRNPRTGLYNYEALLADIRSFILTRRSFCIICIKMINPQNLMQIVGPANIENLTKMTADYLATLVPRYSIFYSNPGTFVILSEKENSYENLELARTVNERFRHEWDFQDRETFFHAAVFCAEVPKDFKTQEEIMALLGSPMTPDSVKKNDVYYGSDLNYFLRRTQVERAILNGLSNRRFEVYYQPIYDAKDMSIRSGEALLRLHDAELGEIYPDEFLPVAERTGRIFELGDFVLDEVCKFLSSGIPVEMGIETLNVNLSIIQCIQASDAERIIQVVSKYDVEPSRINFEIMESAATTDFEGLKMFVKALRDYGFRFSVDDYGIGYSNMHSIFSLDVDVIKIDRSILWEAEQSEVGRIIMESSADMMKRMGRKILISGVESKAQIDLANEFGVDYLQGFFFSNPITQNEFIGILKATQLARMEEQRALAANEAMSSFLANMSHEIRTPINAVLGMDEMILRECEDERIIEYARTIEGAGRTLLSLINDILDFSKIEAGNMDIVESEYDLSSVLGDVVNMVQIKATQKGLRMLVKVEPTTPERLYGDEMRLKQIMLNLLNNAVKYTKQGTVSLEISYERLNKDSVRLIISVRDTGIGIKEEDIEKLFKKFQRLDQNQNRTIEGSGLGLAITHHLLELMGGKIEVESTYGKGSKFTALLPQRAVGDEAVGDFRRKFARAGMSARKYRESFRAPEARVLVVDDTPMNLVVVRELLKKTLVQIEEAHSGAECLELAKAHKYDVIFLDYRMPIMDGIETLRRLGELPGSLNMKTPVVALTANAISGARERFLKEGFDDYMTKPIDGERLEELLLLYLPEDKIRRVREEGTAHEAGAADVSGRRPSIQSAAHESGLDIEQGIQYCGSEEIYRTVFQAFQSDINERAAAIRQAYDEQDWTQYGIGVHAIKSSARTIGASELSFLAEELELAAKEEDIKRIERDTNTLLDKYKRYLDVSIETETPSGNDREEHPVMSEEMWMDACTTLREFALNMDMDNVMLILESMNEYRLSEDKLRREQEIKALVSQLKWDELLLKLDEILQLAQRD